MQSRLINKPSCAHPSHHRTAQPIVARRIFEIPLRRTLHHNSRIQSSPSPSPVKNSSSLDDVQDFFPANDINECGDDEVCLAEKEIVMESVRTMEVDGGQAELAVENVLYDTSTCPHGNIKGIMRSQDEGVLTCSPSDTLEGIIPKLNKVTGMPVISIDGKVIGVISRKDIIKVRRAQGSLQAPVSKHMTSPAITVNVNSSVQDAADLMLGSNIRRLPVVDEEGFPLGIVSRSDIFKPLFMEAYNLFMEKEKLALSEGLPVVKKKLAVKPVTWKVKYLYDGDCPMCLSLMTVLKRQDNGRKLVKFVNIADPDYKPKSHMGITYEMAMETIHAIQPDGQVVYGTDALKILFDTVGLGWATRISEMPLVNKLVDILYEFLSANRLSLGGALDGIIAAKRMDMSKSGKETCSDMDDACVTEW